MTVTSKERFELKKFIAELSKHRGRHTELVSVYIPKDYDINKISNHIFQEQGTASNIKSSATRKNVIDALERMIQHLRLYKTTPPNGLAVFSGNVSTKEGGQDVQIFSIEPPIPLKIRIYRCDKEFVTEPLQDMIAINESYGLVVLDRRDAAMAFLKGKTIIPLRKTHSEVPGKMKAGGQSAPRFARLREGALKEHFKKIAEYMKEEFLNKDGLKGIIIGGPGITVTDFINKGYLTGDLKQKIVGTKDLSYTGDFGLQELLDKSSDILAKEEVAEEKKWMGEFLEKLSKQPNLVSYGVNQVKKCLDMGAVETVLCSEALDEKEIEWFETESAKTGAVVKIISVETREGVQLKDIGKVAALLRYEIEE